MWPDRAWFRAPAAVAWVLLALAAVAGLVTGYIAIGGTLILTVLYILMAVVATAHS